MVPEVRSRGAARVQGKDVETGKTCNEDYRQLDYMWNVDYMRNVDNEELKKLEEEMNVEYDKAIGRRK